MKQTDVNETMVNPPPASSREQGPEPRCRSRETVRNLHPFTALSRDAFVIVLQYSSSATAGSCCCRARCSCYDWAEATAGTSCGRHKNPTPWSTRGRRVRHFEMALCYPLCCLASEADRMSLIYIRTALNLLFVAMLVLASSKVDCT